MQLVARATPHPSLSSPPPPPSLRPLPPPPPHPPRYKLLPLVPWSLGPLVPLLFFLSFFFASSSSLDLCFPPPPPPSSSASFPPSDGGGGGRGGGGPPLRLSPPSSPKNPMIPKEPDVDDVEVNRRPGVRGGAASHMQRDRWRFHPALHTFPDAQRCFEMLWRIL